MQRMEITGLRKLDRSLLARLHLGRFRFDTKLFLNPFQGY